VVKVQKTKIGIRMARAPRMIQGGIPNRLIFGFLFSISGQPGNSYAIIQSFQGLLSGIHLEKGFQGI
jgi:hypothetical protein